MKQARDMLEVATEEPPMVTGFEMAAPAVEFRGKAELITEAEARAQVPATVRSDANALIEGLLRAASDPSCDPEKLGKLFDIIERAEARQAKAAYARAFAAMQPELPVIEERGRIKAEFKKGGSQNTSYAIWDDTMRVLRPILGRHGFGLSHRVGTATDGKLLITGILEHEAGHREETTIPLMHDATGSKNSVQAIGSSISYGRRYTGFALLNLTSTKTEDDDGAAAGGPETITEEQYTELCQRIEEWDVDESKLLAFLKIEELPLLPAKRFDAIMRDLKADAKKRGFQV